MESVKFVESASEAQRGMNHQKGVVYCLLAFWPLELDWGGDMSRRKEERLA